MINLAKTQTITTSHRALKILAALLWLIGGVMLIRKGTELLIEAYALNATPLWMGFAFILGFLFGGLKAKYLFSKACRKNLIRIDGLKQPKIWQFYRPGFFLFLAAMIALGATLSRVAHGNIPFLLSVATLDISLATALLGSSLVFWQEKALLK